MAGKGHVDPNRPPDNSFSFVLSPICRFEVVLMDGKDALLSSVGKAGEGEKYTSRLIFLGVVGRQRPVGQRP